MISYFRNDLKISYTVTLLFLSTLVYYSTSIKLRFYKFFYSSLHQIRSKKYFLVQNIQLVKVRWYQILPSFSISQPGDIACRPTTLSCEICSSF